MNVSDTVAIFWDYENCPAPSNVSGYSIVNNLNSLAHPFGVVRVLKAYLETDQFKSITIRSELQTSGVSLVDCPHNGRKEVADKMILVDMLAYAIDNPAPSTIILITGDRDFAYALSILKHRRYQVVLVTRPNAHASLVRQACVTFDWFNDVVNQPDTSSSQLQRRIQQAKTRDLDEASPCASDMSDGEESDYVYPRKQPQRDMYPAGNTRPPGSPSKNVNKWTPIPTSSRPQNSYYKALESNIISDENPTTTDAYSWQSLTKPTFALFPANGNLRDEENNGLTNVRFCKSLIERLRSPGIKRSRSPSPSNSESSSSSTSPRKEDDNESERYRPLVIPKVYAFLVKILQGHRRKGIEKSFRSVIAGKVSVDHPMYYTVGITTFAELMDRAERDGIVRLGGSKGGQWVCLMPDWFDAVQC